MRDISLCVWVMNKYVSLAGLALFFSLISSLILFFSLAGLFFSITDLTTSLVFFSALVGFNLGFVVLIKSREYCSSNLATGLSLTATLLGLLPFVSLLANVG